MAEWFECKIKYERTMDNGVVKKVNEPYLVDALKPNVELLKKLLHL